TRAGAAAGPRRRGQHGANLGVDMGPAASWLSAGMPLWCARTGSGFGRVAARAAPRVGRREAWAALAQLVRALDCGSRGPPFDPGRRYQDQADAWPRLRLQERLRLQDRSQPMLQPVELHPQADTPPATGFLV